MYGCSAQEPRVPVAGGPHGVRHEGGGRGGGAPDPGPVRRHLRVPPGRAGLQGVIGIKV